MNWVNFQKYELASKFATREPKLTMQQIALKVRNYLLFYLWEDMEV